MHLVAILSFVSVLVLACTVVVGMLSANAAQIAQALRGEGVSRLAALGTIAANDDVRVMPRAPLPLAA